MSNETTTGTATSRLRTGRIAQRKATKARLALSAASGAGKTWTALSTAFVLVPGGRVLGIDTEPGDDRQGAMELYADSFPPFDIIQWEAPYDPRDLTITLREAGRTTVPDGHWPGCQGYDVIIIDSASPFWKGEGGTLDIAGGRFGGWATASPAQEQLVQAILRSPAHLIVCTRAKQAYEVSEVVENGAKKQKVEKLGLQPIQRDDLEYEFQVVVTMDESHRIDVGKTRAAPLAGQSFHANEQGKFAEQYKLWLESGANPARAIDVDAIRHAILTIPVEAERIAAREAFKAEFGDPKYLDAEKVPACWSWVAAVRDVEDHPLVTGEQVGLCVTCGMADRAPWHVGLVETAQGPDPEESPDPDPDVDPGPDDDDTDPLAPQTHTDPDPGTVADQADPSDVATSGVAEGFADMDAVVEHVKKMSRTTLAAELTAAGVAITDPKTEDLKTMRAALGTIIARVVGLAPTPTDGDEPGRLAV